MKRVVITGMGVISPIGNDVQTFWQNLLAGVCGIDFIREFPTDELPVRIAGLVKDFDPLAFGMDKGFVRKQDRFTLYGVAAPAQAVADALELKNVRTLHARGEEVKGERLDFVVSRAVMPLPDLVRCVQRLVSPEQHNALPNGLIALKGGELTDEIGALRRRCTVWDIDREFEEPYFENKRVVHVSL